MPRAPSAKARKTTKPGPASPRSLVRLLGLFEAIARASDGLTLAELSIALESPKSSLLTMLKPLTATGHLLHESGRYRLGPTVFVFAETLLRARQSSPLIRAFMQELWTETKETVLLTAIDREAQLRLGAHVGEGLVVHHRAEQLGAIAAGLLRPIHGRLGVPQKLLARPAASSRDRDDPDARREVDLAAVDSERLSE